MSVLIPKNVLVFGGSGTAGRAAVMALRQAGHRVVTYGRSPDNDITGGLDDLGAIDFSSHSFDTVVSCLASRSGSPADATRIDYQANHDIMIAAKAAGVSQFILLSAICVQKPKLGFQQAKLRFEEELAASGLTYSIVRPTVFFKSLSGQIERLRAGKPFLLFGDGELTACKPISDRDLGVFIASCVTEPEKANRILPIGGAGPALTPKAQGELLFEILDREPVFRHVSLAMISFIINGLSIAGVMSSRARNKADLALIGHYYATESMLVWDGSRYDPNATPEFGTDTLRQHYIDVISGKARVDLGDHAVF